MRIVYVGMDMRLKTKKCVHAGRINGPHMREAITVKKFVKATLQQLVQLLPWR